LDWLKNSWESWPGGFVGAVLIGVAFMAVSSLIWRSILNRIRISALVQKGLINTIGLSVKLPGYFLIVAMAILVGLSNSPGFPAKADWLTAVYLFTSFFLVIFLGEAFFSGSVDYYLRIRRGTDIPSIFQQLVKAITYLIVALSFLSTTYKIDITPLLTTSAVFTMVIGLALQDVLGNLFSGISVHISPPFRLGDWIKVGGYLGKVMESNWRATTLQTPTKDAVILPNNEIAKKDVVNYSQKPGLLYMELPVGLSYDASPERVRQALAGACGQVREIMQNPSPRVLMDAFGDFSVNYRLRYWFADDVDQSTVKDQLLSRIWYRLKRDGLDIPFPVREVHLHPEKDRKAEIVDRRIGLISDVDFLKDIDRNSKVFLASHLREYWFETGETIVERGAAGTDFFIIDQGRVSVYLDDTQKAVAHLESRDFFGEMSLLTGEPRSATIIADEETLLLVLEKETMSYVLKQNFDIAQVLSSILAERSAKNISHAEREGAEIRASDSLKSLQGDETRQSSILLERIKRFFRIV